MNQNHKTILRHLILWTLYAAYFFGINRLGNENISIITVLYSLPVFMLIYYGISYSLNVHLYRKHYLQAIGMALLIYGVTFIGVYNLTSGRTNLSRLFTDYMTSKPDFKLNKFMQTYLQLIGSFSIWALLGYLNRLKVLSVQKEQQERESRRRYEYTTLAQQVSPHLLANIFQFLEYQLKDMRPELRNQLLELYSLMRYFMDSNRPDGPTSVILEDEILITKQYISINDTIASKKSNFIWDIKGNTYGSIVPSTCLLTLVNNVYKHGDPYSMSHPAKIRVIIQQEGFRIIMTNKVRSSNCVLDSHRMGLENLKGRLKYVYDKNFKMFYSVDDEIFKVSLLVNF